MRDRMANRLTAEAKWPFFSLHNALFSYIETYLPTKKNKAGIFQTMHLVFPIVVVIITQHPRAVDTVLVTCSLCTLPSRLQWCIFTVVFF